MDKHDQSPSSKNSQENIAEGTQPSSGRLYEELVDSLFAGIQYQTSKGGSSEKKKNNKP